MRFVISSGDLKSAVNEVAKAMPQKSIIPIMDCIRMDVKDGEVKVSACSEESAMTVFRVPVSVDDSGSICANGKMLQSALGALSEQPLEVVLEDKVVQFNYTRGHFAIPTENTDEWPTIETIEADKANAITLPAKDMLSALMHAVATVGDDDLRPVVSGVFCDITDGKANFVGTDGHCLTCSTIKDGALKGDWGVILPRKSVEIIRSTKAAPFETLSISVGERRFCATFSESRKTISGRIIDGKYPRWRAVIPTTYAHDVQFSNEDLMSAIKRVRVFASQSSQLVKLDMAGNTIVASANDLDFNRSAEETISCSSDGAQTTIGFNASKLMNVLSLVGGTGEGTIMRYNSPEKAAVLIPVVQPENMGVLALIMPMSIQ